MILIQGCQVGKNHNVKTIVFENKNDFDSIVQYYTKALKKKPDSLDLKIRLKRSKLKASDFHTGRAEQLLKKKYYRKAIEELRLAIAFYPGNTKAIELIGAAKMLKQSQYFYNKGRQQVKTNDYKQARKSFQRSLQLNPGNKEAKAAFESYMRKKEQLSFYNLDYRTDAPVSLKFKKTPVLNVFEILSKLSGINFIFDKDVKETRVTLFMTDVSFDKFLQVLLKTNMLKGKIINSKTMLVYPDTKGKAKEYTDLYVRTFYLSSLDAKQAVVILTRLLKSKNIIPNKKLNSVTVRGEKEEIYMAEKIIKANDLTPSEVVLNLEILEVSRSLEKDLGLSLSDTITFGVSRTSSGIDYNSAFGYAGLGSLKDISNLSNKELYLSLPTATLKLLKQHGDTKILARPQIRVSSSEKASILIGERVPIRTNRKVQTDGTTTYDFQYQDVGVKLQVEPVINRYDQVTMRLNIEVSALSSNVGTLNDPQYAIKTRTIKTVMTINDGGNVIIGGLIQDEDRLTTRKIPLAGDIPALGKIFSSNNNKTGKTDILMSITPVIIRHQEVSVSEFKGFWSGTQNDVSSEVPAMEKVKIESGLKNIPDKNFIKSVVDKGFLQGNNCFSIQVYSARKKKDADNMAAVIRKQGYAAWIKPGMVKGKGRYFRVFAGQFTSYDQAEQARLDMNTTGIFSKDIHIVDKDYVYKK